jgi:hypothetical protein
MARRGEHDNSILRKLIPRLRTFFRGVLVLAAAVVVLFAGALGYRGQTTLANRFF